MNTQQPHPNERDETPSQNDPANPTATAPDSVEESVYEEAEYVGKDGPDAASRPTAEGKPEKPGPTDSGPGADLDADESAAAFETKEEASRKRTTQRDDLQDEDIISLDGSD